MNNGHRHPKASPTRPTKVWIDGRPPKPCRVDDKAREFFVARLNERATNSTATLLSDGTPAKPIAILTVGAPGSGKTTALARLYPDAVSNFFVIDPDQIVEQVDVYRESLDIHDPRFKACNVVVGLKQAWMDCIESAVGFSIELVHDAARRRVNVLVDQPSASSRFASVFHKAGYHVIVLWFAAPAADVFDRAIKRAERTGRFQPFYKTIADVERMQNTAHNQFLESLPYADEAYVVDTSLPLPMRTPWTASALGSSASASDASARGEYITSASAEYIN